MKKTFFLFFGLLLIFAAEAQIPSYSHKKEEFNLKGKIKSVEQHCYEAVYNNGKYEKGECVSGYDNDVHNLIYEFDEAGNLLHLKRLRPNGTLGLNVAYLYEEGDLSRIVWDPQTTYVFKYNDHGKIAEKTHYIRGNVFDVTRYSYDDLGRLSKEARKKYNMAWTFFYNDLGQLTQKIYKSDVKVTSDYVYDTDGFLRQLIDNGKIRYEYSMVEKDEIGNWNRLILKSVVSDAYFLLERQIEYYD